MYTTGTMANPQRMPTKTSKKVPITSGTSDTIRHLRKFQEKRAYKARDMQIFFENVQDEIFKILKIFKSNMIFSRAAC